MINDKIIKIIRDINTEIEKRNLQYHLYIVSDVELIYNKAIYNVNILSSTNNKILYKTLFITYVSYTNYISIDNYNKEICLTDEKDVYRFINWLDYNIGIIVNSYNVLSKIFNLQLWHDFFIMSPKYKNSTGHIYRINYLMNGTFALLKRNNDVKLDYEVIGNNYSEIENIIQNILKKNPELKVKTFFERCINRMIK